MLRNSMTFAAFALVAAMLVCETSSAAIVGTATLTKDPPGTPFGAPDAALSAPWKSYVLSVNANAGETIQAIEVNIGGSLHQRWDDSDFDGDPTNNPSGNSTNKTNGDTHLLAPAGSLFGSGPTEDNPATGSPLANPDPTSRIYGVGTTLQGAWALTGGAVGSAADVAYLVIDPSTLPNFTAFSVKIANPVGDTIGQLGCADFFGSACQIQTGVAPLVADVSGMTTALGDVINLTPVDSAPGTPPVTWSALAGPTYTPGFGAPGDAPGLGTATWSWDPNTQAFQFSTLGSTRGTYVWTGSASNATGSDPFSITVDVKHVPEPATLSLIGLALVGCIGLIRRR